MTKRLELNGECNEDSPVYIMACIRGAADALVTQASITSISYLVKQYSSADDARDNANGTTITSLTSAGSVSSLIYDTLQTGSGWSGPEGTGFNFRMPLPVASFPTGGKWYVVEVWVDPVSGDDFLGSRQVFYCYHTAKD